MSKQIDGTGNRERQPNVRFFEPMGYIYAVVDFIRVQETPPGIHVYTARSSWVRVESGQREAERQAHCLENIFTSDVRVGDRRAKRTMTLPFIKGFWWIAVAPRPSSAKLSPSSNTPMKAQVATHVRRYRTYAYHVVSRD